LFTIFLPGVLLSALSSQYSCQGCYCRLLVHNIPARSASAAS
jgi:hypothetical protein